MNIPLRMVFLFFLMQVSHAASFDCTKGVTLVEKAICSDNQLSRLDEILALSYKQALAVSTNTQDLKRKQAAWLDTRNKCKDAACIMRSYLDRIGTLNNLYISSVPVKNHGIGNIVLGRCHMDYCWWWKIEEIKLIRSEVKGILVKAYVRSTEGDYYYPNGYPENPPENARWSAMDEAYLFCSNSLPVYISYDEEKQKFIGTVPFSENGETYGAVEGIGSLYLHVCANDRKSIPSIKADVAHLEIMLDNPVDIFEAY